MLKQSKSVEPVDIISAEAHHFFRISPDLMILLDFESNVLLLNDAWVQSLGYTMDELMQERTTQTMHPIDFPNSQRLYQELVEGKLKETNYEERRVCKDGTYKYFIWNLVSDPIKGLIYGIGRENTELREQRIALQENEEKFHFLSDHVTQAISVCVDNRIIMVNKAYEELTGYTDAELIGTCCIDQVPEKWREFVLKMIESNYELPHESEILRKDGSTVSVEVIAKNILYQNQEARISAISNINRKKEHTEKIKITEDRFNALFLSSPVGITIINVSGSIVDVNPVIAKRLDYSISDVKEMQFIDLVHPEEAKKVKKLIDKIFSREQQSFEIETQMLKNGGGSSWFKLMISAMSMKNSEATAVVFMENIDKRKHAEHKLELKNDELTRINQELEHFAYVASHDLQEPLRTITSFIQILDRKYGNMFDEDGKQFMGYITDGTRRMQNLIRDLLAYSRVNRFNTNYEEVDLNDVFDAVNQALNDKINENDAIILAENLPVIQGNKIQLIQVFQNFIDNAIKFRGKKPPEITIDVIELSDKWQISFTDNGIGIAPEYFQRIFVIFQRLHSMDEYTGTGIGLAMCKKIIERHGGEVWVESKVGKGTVFYFTVAKNLIGPAA